MSFLSTSIIARRLTPWVTVLRKPIDFQNQMLLLAKMGGFTNLIAAVTIYYLEPVLFSTKKRLVAGMTGNPNGPYEE